MKPAAFDYERPASLAEAVALLRDGNGGAKVIAGGQSLAPMLNLRLATPQRLVDVTRIPELRRAEDVGDAIVLGACVTHADIEDGRVPDATRGAMARVARGIAYRAVRNRGTIGGSLAHADPSADWPTCLTALGAIALIAGPHGQRSIPVAQFVAGVFETALADDEILEAVRVPKLGARARFGFYKFCRKTGKFAEAMCAVLFDPERSLRRAVLGATDGKPILVSTEDVPGPRAIDDPLSETALAALLDSRSIGAGTYARQIHLVSFRRALAQAQPS